MVELQIQLGHILPSPLSTPMLVNFCKACQNRYQWFDISKENKIFRVMRYRSVNELTKNAC